MTWIALGGRARRHGDLHLAAAAAAEGRARRCSICRTFKSYNFSVSNVMFVIGMASMFGSLNLLPYYLQNVLKLEPLYIGLILLPGAP